MYGLIKTGIRLSALLLMYSVALTYILDWVPVVAEFFVVSGVPPLILTVISCTISTLNWLFSPAIIRIGIAIWLLLPAVKLTLYFTHKVASI